MKSIRKIAAVVASVSLLGCMAACSDNSGAESASAGGDTTINWTFWNQGDELNKIWEGLAAKASEADPAVKVNLTQAPFADYFTKLQSQLAGGTAPCLISMQSLRLPAFKDALTPLDDVMPEGYFSAEQWDAGSLKALQYDGKQYAIPFGMSTLVMYYNEDIFAAAGLPVPDPSWTIEDFEKAAKTITEKTDKLAFGQSFSDLHMFSMLHSFNGATPVSKDGELQLSTPEMQEAFEWYSGLSTEQNVASTPASSSDVPWGEQQFLAGNVAMAVDGTWNIADNASNVEFKIGTVPLPAGKNGSGTFSANSGFGISSSCENKEAAAKVLEVITSEEAAMEQAQRGSAPARLSAMDAFFESMAASVDTKNPGYSEQARETMEAASQNAIPFISTSNWDETTKQIARYFVLSYSGSTTPAEALKTVEEASK
ncbi:sugar ABC transporter substrate-binding protein [Pauljensenia sp. UMB10120]|uniref:ABC transporter substrate-binding protein n=1 Tax=Pauljensenia sp. UMB10120 TaxID=3046356 RepID=UPI00254C6A27|nr:sugar ABC transporter substrate-binding protein [Pauljensenia sp. UMB10120]MDK6242132.1 sugar ABC transporter substrate-binding protein [Pauljensenia sp. UMB10120]